MANTKKSVVQDELVEDIVQEEVVPTTKKKVVKVKHDADELIPCRSVIFGELFLIGPKTKMVYSWANQGDIREVEYQDLMSLKATRSSYLFAPYIIIEDEDLCDEWKADVGKVYESFNAIDLNDLFSLSQRQFVAQLKKLPKSVKESVQNMAYDMIQNRTLYDLRKIEAIDEILGTELKLMI